MIPTNVEADNEHIVIEDLPEVTLANLEDLEKVFMLGRGQREFFLDRILDTNFLEQFLGLYDQTQDENDYRKMSFVLKCIFFLNSTKLFSMLFHDKVFLRILEILDYDYDYPTGNFKKVFEQIVFKKIIRIDDGEVLEKISLVHRANFVKDIVLARTLEDSTFAALNFMINTLQSDILHYFDTNLNKIDELFMASKEPENRMDALMFLLELCQMAKPLAREKRLKFLNQFENSGLFELIESTLQDKSIDIRTKSVAVLFQFLDNSPIGARKYCIEKEKDRGSTLLDILIEAFLVETDPGISSQIIDNIKALLDTTGIGAGLDVWFLLS
jgi:protein phosphatase-4 regulatory subunit 3